MQLGVFGGQPGEEVVLEGNELGEEELRWRGREKGTSRLSFQFVTFSGFPKFLSSFSFRVNSSFTFLSELR